MLSYEYDVYRNEEFGTVFCNVSIDDFFKSGFALGDSVDIEFSVGYKIEDVPIYDGYYVKIDAPLVLTLATSYRDILIAYNYGPHLYDKLGLKPGDKCRITLREKGKYKNVVETIDVSYSTNPNDYKLIEDFTNFRPLKGGKLKKNYIYRSASPCGKLFIRSDYVSKMFEKYHISYAINLTDTEQIVENVYNGTELVSSYWRELYRNNKVLVNRLTANFRSKEYGLQLADLFRKITKLDEPNFVIHCYEGRDRTGVVCFVLQALAGANSEEVEDEYMESFRCFNNISKHVDINKYNVHRELYYDDFVRSVCKVEDINMPQEQLHQNIINYLVDNCEMTLEEIDALTNKISE
ncbi:MAG: tyrosine-protein phosphatase [Erysipelotrichaceae bacterium]|nr:tyrosine-protein phosphatase [Erysipelotrichaceae bacterium]